MIIITQRDDKLMKYLPEELRSEYDYLTRNYPDIEGISHPLINLSDAFRAYFILADYFTDESAPDEREKMLVGIRSVDLLASALGRQIVSFEGRQKYTLPLDICATTFFGIVKNHSFSDGNKRTALLLLLYQLQLYGYYPTARKEEFEELVLHVADNTIDSYYQSVYEKCEDQDDPVIKTISLLLNRMTLRKDNTYHIDPTSREFCMALKDIGATYHLENGKLRFSYKNKDLWKKLNETEKNYSIPFGGWTRTIGAKTARDVLKALDLYDQYPTYQKFLDGVEPLYTLVDNFKEPLRRLKDE